MLRIQGKPVKFVMSRRFVDELEPVHHRLFALLVADILPRHPVDMLVFESDDQHLTVRSAGYFVEGPRAEQLDEATVVYRNAALPIETFWFKLDDQGDFWSGTFLFPDEY